MQILTNSSSQEEMKYDLEKSSTLNLTQSSSFEEMMDQLPSKEGNCYSILEDSFEEIEVDSDSTVEEYSSVKRFKYSFDSINDFEGINEGSMNDIKKVSDQSIKSDSSNGDSVNRENLECGSSKNFKEDCSIEEIDFIENSDKILSNKNFTNSKMNSSDHMVYSSDHSVYSSVSEIKINYSVAEVTLSNPIQTSSFSMTEKDLTEAETSMIVGKTKYEFNFLTNSNFNVILPFFITVMAKRNPGVYYGCDSTAFCVLKYSGELENKRYIVYGKLSKDKYYFLEVSQIEKIDYKSILFGLID